MDGNPLEIPPMDIVNKGVEAVKEFMAKRWQDYLLEEERRMPEMSKKSQAGWMSWLNDLVSGVSQSLTSHFRGAKTTRDPYLDQML